MNYKQQAFCFLSCSSDSICKSTDECTCFKQITPVQRNQIIRTLSKAEQDVRVLTTVLKEASELIEVLTPFSYVDCLEQLNQIRTILKEF